MNRGAPASDPRRAALLLFSVGGVRFGIEAGQVAAMSACAPDAGSETLPFHRIVGYGDAAVAYRAPAVVSVRDKEGRPLKVVIDAPEEIAEFAWSDIHPLPSLLEPRALLRGIWGVLRRGTEIILLVDANRWQADVSEG